jgi:hypothetical protein
MATVDASIPLQVQQPEDYSTTTMKALQTGEAMQQFQGQRALKEAFQGADMSTPEGQAALVQKVGAADPNSAMALQGQFLKQQESKSTMAKNKATTDKTQLETQLKKAEVVDDHMSVLMAKYTDLVQNKKMPPQDAARIISADIPVIKSSMAQQKMPDGTPMISQEELARMPDQFDPNTFGSKTMNIKNMRAQLDYELKLHQQQNTEHHQKVEEKQGQQRIGIEAQNSSINAGRLSEERDYHSKELGLRRQQIEGDPTTIERNADLIGTGKMAPPTGAALRNPVMAATMARVQEKYPKFDAKDYGTQSTAEKAFTTGKQGNTVRSLNVAMSHLDVLDEAGKALKNGNMTDFNKLANNLAARTGNPAPTNFNEAKKIVSDEVVKAVVGAGGGVSDREEAAKAFNEANSPAQLSGAIKTAKKLLSGQLGGLKKQYETSTGKTDFDTRFLSDETKSLEGAPLPGKGQTASVNKPPLPAGADFSHLWN